MLKVKKRKNDISCTAAEEEHDINKTLNKTDRKLHLFSGNKTLLSILSRTAVFFFLFLVVYYKYNYKENAELTLAKRSEFTPGIGQLVQCSKDYLQEVEKYDNCSPRECKRFITDKLVSIEDSEELLAIFKKGLNFGRSSGAASILDIHSGALSTGKYFMDIYKSKTANNLFTENDFNIYKAVKNKIKQSVAHHYGADPKKLYLTYPTFFSEITSKDAVTIHDEYWHPHVDKETYRSFHYTSLLYLGDYNVDFKGGRFVFIDKESNTTIEPRKARVSMFTSGSENLHFVEKVTEGVRYALTIAFTCDKQFAIKDPSIQNYQN